MTTKKKKTLKDRLKNPFFIAAAAAFVYKGYTTAAAVYGLPQITADGWKEGVNLAAYVFMGIGVYHTYDK